MRLVSKLLFNLETVMLRSLHFHKLQMKASRYPRSFCFLHSSRHQPAFLLQLLLQKWKTSPKLKTKQKLSHSTHEVLVRSKLQKLNCINVFFFIVVHPVDFSNSLIRLAKILNYNLSVSSWHHLQVKNVCKKKTYLY